MLPVFSIYKLTLECFNNSVLAWNTFREPRGFTSQVSQVDKSALLNIPIFSQTKVRYQDTHTSVRTPDAH